MAQGPRPSGLEIKLDSVGPLAAAKKVSPERSPSPPSYEQPLSGFGSGDPLTDKSTETFAAMSAIFEGYEKELLELNSAITRKAASIPTLTRDERKAKVNEAENELAEAEALLRRMDLEARSLPVSVKTPLLTKLRDYKTKLANLKASVKKAGAALLDSEGQRDELLSRAELGDTAGGAATSSAQRDRLLSAHDQLRKTGDRIAEGKKQLLETEELGASILVNLKGQREQIVNTRETLHGADDNIGRSRRILTSMARRAMQNKIILGVIILILLICIIAVAVAKGRHSGR